MSDETMASHESNDAVYKQGLANLALEGFQLSYTQNKLARLYQAGKLSKEDLISKAKDYARS